MDKSLGTDIQQAAQGLQNTYLDADEDPQLPTGGVAGKTDLFASQVTISTRHVSEDREHRPAQAAAFGQTVVVEVGHAGHMLGDMHVQFRVPAVQPQLGSDLAPVSAPPTVQETAVAAASGTAAWFRGSLVLQGFGSVTGSVRAMASGQGRVWTFETAGLQWLVAVYDGGLVRSTLTGSSSGTRVLTFTPTAGAVTRLQQRVGLSVAFYVLGDGAVAARNDVWGSPLAHVLMRRVRFVVDGTVIHDHERLWYDLLDRLTMHEGHAAGLREMLGTDLSMGAEHVIMLPLKFMCCTGARSRRAFFPIGLLPYSTVQVELDLESFAGCYTVAAVPVTPPASLDMLLVVQHILLEDDEATAMAMEPTKLLMIEGVQDMEASNYTESSVGADGRPAMTARATVDLSELNLPVRALVWAVYAEPVQRHFQYLDMVEGAALMFGSLEREVADGPTFSKRQVWSHSPRGPANVYTYSFALRPWGKGEPCGACDFSLVQKPVLRLQLRPEAASVQLKCKVFGATYNWLRFEDHKVAPVFSV